MVDFLRRKADQKTYDLVEALQRSTENVIVAGEMNNTSVLEVTSDSAATGVDFFRDIKGRHVVPLDDEAYDWEIVDRNTLRVNLDPGDTAHFLLIDAK